MKLVYTILAMVFLCSNTNAACISEQAARNFVAAKYPSATISKFSGKSAKTFLGTLGDKMEGGDTLFIGKLPDKPNKVAVASFKKGCLLDVNILSLDQQLKSRIAKL